MTSAAARWFYRQKTASGNPEYYSPYICTWWTSRRFGKVRYEIGKRYNYYKIKTKGFINYERSEFLEFKDERYEQHYKFTVYLNDWYNKYLHAPVHQVEFESALSGMRKNIRSYSYLTKASLLYKPLRANWQGKSRKRGRSLNNSYRASRLQ
jgi:hypothetical protein